MKAMVLEKTGPAAGSPLSQSFIPEAEPAPDEIVVAVSACGVCRTDLHIVEGDLDLPRLPLVPGHQVVGTVERAGRDCSRFTPGDRVGVGWLHSTCRQCEFCLSERENLCPTARFTGYHVDGGYAERLLVTEDFAYPVPEGFPDMQAAPLLCAGIIGYRALKLSGARSGGRLGIFGFGGSAHVTIQVARHQRIETYVFTRGEDRRRLAEGLGAVWTGGIEDRPAAALDAAIVFAPAGEVVPHALEAVGRGGTVALAGIHMSPLPGLEYQRHLFFEKVLRTVTASTHRDGEELMALAAEIPIRTTVTAYPLAGANQALLDLKEGRVSGAAVLMVSES